MQPHWRALNAIGILNCTYRMNSTRNVIWTSAVVDINSRFVLSAIEKFYQYLLKYSVQITYIFVSTCGQVFCQNGSIFFVYLHITMRTLSVIGCVYMSISVCAHGCACASACVCVHRIYPYTSGCISLNLVMKACFTQSTNISEQNTISNSGIKISKWPGK